MNIHKRHPNYGDGCNNIELLFRYLRTYPRKSEGKTTLTITTTNVRRFSAIGP